MDTFDLFVDLWKIFLNWTRSNDITIGSYSFTFLDFWIFTIVASIIISFIIHVFNS